MAWSEAARKASIEARRRNGLKKKFDAKSPGQQRRVQYRQALTAARTKGAVDTSNIHALRATYKRMTGKNPYGSRASDLAWSLSWTAKELSSTSRVEPLQSKRSWSPARVRTYLKYKKDIPDSRI